MFLSAKQLINNYGLDEQISKFFVDREPPKDNLYWHEKLLYLRPAPGYIFIPLIVDLYAKLGIDREQLLSEEFVGTMEQIGHISALEETRQITGEEAIEKGAALVRTMCKNKEWFSDLVDFLKASKENFFTSLSTPFKALHRGDLFLFSICALEFPKELKYQIAEQWFALISVLLIQDDIDDIQSDKVTGDENAFLQSGLTREGFDRVLQLEEECLKKIAVINLIMARQLKSQLKLMMERPDIAKFINEL